MKRSCGSYANKRLPCTFCLSFFFSFVGFFEQWTPDYIYIYIYIFFFCHEQCCLFEFSSLAVILKCSRCFINFIPYPMTDPSHPFMLVLMMLVFKRISLRIPNTLSPSNTNTFHISLSSPCSPSQTLSSVYSYQPPYHDASGRPKFFPP